MDSAFSQSWVKYNNNLRGVNAKGFYLLLIQ